MDGRTDPLNDAALEQEIEGLLSVEPSADFVARVRSRVAEEPTSIGWSWRWPLAAIATAVVAAVVAIVLWRPAETTMPSTSAPAPRVAVTDVPGSASAAPREEPRVVAVHRPVPRVVAPHRTIELALPPVIIAENEIRAFAALTANTRARFEVAAPAVADREAFVVVKKMQAMEPVTVDPIEIEPLVEAATLE